MMKATKFLTLICCCLAFAVAGCASSRTLASPRESPEPIVCMPVEPAGSFPESTAAAAQAGTPTPNLDLAPIPAQAPAPVLVASAAPQELIHPVQEAPQVTGERFQPLATVSFPFDSYLLDDQAIHNLDQFYLSVKDGTVALTLEGFCDERGDDEYNLGLSDLRSNAVRKYLVSRGLDPKLFNSVGYGREYPIDPGHNEQAWQVNRRVEIVKSGAPKPGSRKRYGTEE